MPGESLVQEGVARTPQFEWIAVVAQLTEQEELRLGRHRIAQGDGEPGKGFRIGIGIAETIEGQPREEEPGDECARAIVLEHAPHVTLERSGIAEAVPLYVREQRGVRRAVPQKARQSFRDLRSGRVDGRRRGGEQRILDGREHGVGDRT
ncbi:hypothetical protein D3C83_09310 [compost metagenome]